MRKITRSISPFSFTSNQIENINWNMNSEEKKPNLFTNLTNYPDYLPGAFL